MIPLTSSVRAEQVISVRKINSEQPHSIISTNFIPEHDALSLSSTNPASHPQVNDPSVLVHTWWQMLGPVLHSSISSPTKAIITDPKIYP